MSCLHQKRTVCPFRTVNQSPSGGLLGEYRSGAEFNAHTSGLRSMNTTNGLLSNACLKRRTTNRTAVNSLSNLLYLDSAKYNRLETNGNGFSEVPVCCRSVTFIVVSETSIVKDIVIEKSECVCSASLAIVPLMTVKIRCAASGTMNSGLIFLKISVRGNDFHDVMSELTA